MDPSQADLKKTPLNAVHRQMGARMVPFGGWDMPVQYSGILDEHRAVRGSAGLFDISHMGEIELKGPSALAAVQGPRAPEILQKLTRGDLSQIRYYWFQRGKVLDVDAIISRTGYTGEDGFEIYLDLRHAETLWWRLLGGGKPYGVIPAGLGARDPLRLEAKMALYGNDIDDKHTVLEADLGWIVKFEKGEFVGRAALQKQQAAGLKRKLVGFEMVGRGIARSHYKVVKDGQEIGEGTSGGPSPPPRG